MAYYPVTAIAKFREEQERDRELKEAEQLLINEEKNLKTKEEWLEMKQKKSDSAQNRKVRAESEIAKIRCQLLNPEKSYAKYVKQCARNVSKTVEICAVSVNLPQTVEETSFSDGCE